MVGVHFFMDRGSSEDSAVDSTRSTDHSIMHANRLKYGRSHRLLGGCVLRQDHLW
jgi:hypothetical protein